MINSKYEKFIYIDKEIRKEKNVTMHTAGGKDLFNFLGIILRQNV